MPILNFNIDALSGDAFDFTGQIRLTVSAGVTVMSELGDAVHGNFASGLITNFGAIVGSAAGVDLLNSGICVVANEAGAVIEGNLAVAIGGSGDTVINDGQLIGVSDAIGDSGGNLIENSGYIFGEFGGISTRGGEHINNSGTISGGIGIASLTTTPDVIDSAGVIRGSVHSISEGGIAPFILDNSGRIVGAVNLTGSGGDTIANTGIIKGAVQLGAGANTFDNRGGLVVGAIRGGTGADLIFLGDGAETVDGGAGHDKLVGGLGADTFQFTSKAAADSDVIVGFHVANDTISLDHAAFAKLVAGATPTFSIASSASSPADHLFYNSATGNLFYDPDGSGAQAADLIARLAPGLHLTAGNFLVV